MMLQIAFANSIGRDFDSFSEMVLSGMVWESLNTVQLDTR